LSRWFAASLVAALALAASAGAEVRLGISGAVESGPPRVVVRVDLANGGDVSAEGVSIEVELLGQRQVSRLEEALPALVGGSAVFTFDVGAVRPGVYPLAIHVQYARSATAGDTASQRGYLLLALGANPSPAVRLAVRDVHLDTLAPVVVRIESADLKKHRVRLRMLAPRGLQPFGPDAEVDVPAFGSATAEMQVLRGGAPRPSQQGIVVLAETVGEAVANAGAGIAVVDVLSDPAWMPRGRRVLLALGLLLLGAAAGLEVRRRRGERGGRAGGAEPPPVSP
jgi:hypothetical protein